MMRRLLLRAMPAAMRGENGRSRCSLCRAPAPSRAVVRTASSTPSSRAFGAARGLCTAPRPPAHDRPDEATVKKLAESAHFQQRMWDTFVPEQGIRFGDKRFWALLFFVGGLHLFNNWREANAPRDPDLPPGAVRRLPQGGLLMADGSIGKEEAVAAPHTLHKVKDVGENELILDRMWRRFKESV